MPLVFSLLSSSLVIYWFRSLQRSQSSAVASSFKRSYYRPNRIVSYMFQNGRGGASNSSITSPYPQKRFMTPGCSTPHVPAISPLGQIVPRIWARTLLPFQLPDDYDLSRVAEIFRRGLFAAAQKHPELSCEVVLDKSSMQGGALKLEPISFEQFEPLVIQDLRHFEQFPLSFSDLRNKSFPPSAFDPKIFCATPIFPIPGQRICATLVQLNFIRGGLIMSWSQHHSTFDASSHYIWAETWANECRRLQEARNYEPLNTLEGCIESCRPPHTTPVSDTSQTAYTVLQDPRQQLRKYMASLDDYEAIVIHFSRKEKERLKKDAFSDASIDSAVKYVSTADAITALLWKTLVATEISWGTLHTHTDAEICIAVGSRHLADHRDPYLSPGCYLTLVQAHMPIQTMMDHNGLAQSAACIRKALHQRVSNAVAQVEFSKKQPELGIVAPRILLNMPGSGCASTSHEAFNLCDLDWGDELGGKVPKMRSPSTGLLPGLMTILPQLLDGSTEVIFSIPRRCITDFKKDGTLLRYAKVVN